MFDIFDYAYDSKHTFPIECPICKKLDAHVFMHRFGTRNGGAWAWCGACRNFAHMSGILPVWWVNLPSIDPSMLSSEIQYLNDRSSAIDAWVNSLMRESPAVQVEIEASEQDDTWICEKCGHEMSYYMSTSECGMLCESCGWGFVTTYIEPIYLDKTEYTLCIAPIETPSIEVIRCIANTLMCNYLNAKERLTNEIVLKNKAVTIRDLARALHKCNINYTITPDYPYNIIDTLK
jgi:hypothetical protein